ERAILSPSGGRHVHKAGIQLAERRVAELQIGHGPRPKVLHHDIGAADKLAEYLLSLRRFEIERDRALVAIQADEGRAFAVQQGRHMADLVAAVRRLDLDDLCAQVGELHPTERSGHVIAHLQDPDPREWRVHAPDAWSIASS